MVERPSRTLREDMIARYVSSSPRAHRVASPESLAAYERAYAKYLASWISGDANTRWLDLACGQGGLVRLAKSVGFHVLGVDQSEEMVRLCRAAGLPVEQGEVLDFLSRSPSNSWNIISAFDLLEHLDRDDGYRLLREVKRALTPNGLCLLKLPNGDSPWSISVMSSDFTHETLYSPDSLEQLANLAGFRRCEFREVGPVCTGVAATVRWTLWKVVKAIYRGLNLVETGSSGRGIDSRVMLARLTK